MNGDEIIGSGGGESFSQTGGSNTIGSPVVGGDLTIGSVLNAPGFYLLQSGPLSLFHNLTVGDAGLGTLNQTGGTLTVGDGTGQRIMVVGNAPGSIGQIGLSGNAFMQVFGNELIGSQGLGTFTQSGGTHHIGSATIIGQLYIGANVPGFYALSAGSLIVEGSEIVRNGTFRQSGGTNRQQGSGNSPASSSATSAAVPVLTRLAVEP